MRHKIKMMVVIGSSESFASCCCGWRGARSGHALALLEGNKHKRDSRNRALVKL